MTLPRPQRLTPPSAVGSLLKSTAVPPRRISPEEGKQPDYLALVRQCPCLKCGMEPSEAQPGCCQRHRDDCGNRAAGRVLGGM